MTDETPMTVENPLDVPQDPNNQCTAKSKRSGKRCKRRPSIGKKVCAMHGGKSPSGIAHYNYKMGLTSKAMPVGLAEKFRELAEDPELLSLVRRIGILEARLLEVLGELGKPGASWRRVIAAKDAMKQARSRDDMVGLRTALNELTQAIEAGEADNERWETIERLLESTRKFIDSISKNQLQNTQAVTLVQLNSLFTGLAQSVRKAFVGLMAQLHAEQDKKAVQTALRAVSEDFQKLTNVRAHPLLTEKVQ